MRNFKKIGILLLLMCLFIAVNEGLNYMLYPNTYSRIDMHHVETGDYEDLIVGTSHGKCGLDPRIISEITGRKTLNACQGGQYPQDVLYIVKDAARTHKLSRVIYEVDPAYWETQQGQSPDYITFYHEMEWSGVKAEYFLNKMLDADFRTILFPWYFYRKNVKTIPELLESKQGEVYQTYDVTPFCSTWQTFREDGFFARHPSPDDKQVKDVPTIWDSNGPRKKSMKAVDELVEFCKENQIDLVMVMLPLPKVTYEKYEESYEEAVDYMETYTGEKEVFLYNYWNCDDPEVPFELEEFADYDGHMYEEAALRFSRIFAQALN